MNSRMHVAFMVMALSLLVAACNPSPYDLTVRVIDREGNSIPSVKVALAELEDVQISDENGEVTWMDLSENAATVIIATEGYLLETKRATLERGQNRMVVTLKPDPTWQESFSP